MTIELIVDSPITLYLMVESDGRKAFSQLLELDVDLAIATARGVELAKLPTVMRTGIDVEPTSAVFYTAELEKAFEYGEWPKLVMLFDKSKLSRTFLEVEASTPDEEITRLQRTYPTKLVSKDEKTIWLSKLADSDPRVCTEYEWGYARWIEGDPVEALKAVLLVARDVDDIQAIRDCLGSGT